MKTIFKSLLIIGIIILLSNSITAQDWSLTGNAPIGTQFLGTTNGTDVRFRTNNTQRMVLSSAGLLGLNVTAPASMFHLADYNSGALFRSDGWSGATNSWDIYTGTSAPFLLPRFSLFVNPSGGATGNMVNLQANYGHTQFITADAANGANLHARMRINGYVAPQTIQSFTNQNTTGFVGITADNNYWTDALSPKTPVSLLHLVGDYNGSIPFSYRPWMRNGISFTLGADMGFIGPRLVNEESDIFEMVVAWGDNLKQAEHGPDVLSFRAMAGNGLQTGIPGDVTGSDADGREIMRLTGTGHVGVGPNFSPTNMPKADLHINTAINDSLQPGMADAKIQLSVRETSVTGESATDGFQISTEQMAVANESGTAFLRQYENRSIRVISSINTSGSTLGERMRISSVSDPITGNPATFFGANTTRIGVSTDGGTALTQPRSVLHIGANLNADNDGWRNWMNTGTLNNIADKHCYFGVRNPESGTINTEATVAWGKQSYTDGGTQMPLRFIFTTDYSAGATDESPAHTHGREIARMNSNGWMGIGTQSPANRLEINTQNTSDPYYSVNNMTAGQEGSSGLKFSRLRSSNLAVENPGDGVLSVDDNGNVIYVEGGSGVCEWDEDVNGTDMFTGTPTACHTGDVGIGIVPVNADIPGAKLSVYRDQPLPSNGNLGAFIHAKTGSPFNTGTHSFAEAEGDNVSRNLAIYGRATGNATSNMAFQGWANGGFNVRGGNFSSTTLSDGSSYAVQADASGTDECIGVLASSYTTAGGSSSIGVYASATNTGVSGIRWAVWSNGDSYATGLWQTSDSNLKDNIMPIENASGILNNLNAKHYSFRTEEYPQLNLPSGTHYGLVSQELEEILPDLVKETRSVAKYDSLYNVIEESITFKTVNYIELIPILIAGFKEQQSKINAMQDQINGCCSAHGEVTPDSPGMPTGNPQHQQSITLTNADKAMLGFASPNPNKGEVYVDYYIPTGHSGTAEMLFTDATGRPVQNVLITGKGNGRLNIDTANLASGQYQYTLIVDGEIIATRKMIRE